MSQIIHADFNGYDLTFQDDGWFNATAAAERFGKRVDVWLKTQETQDYISALCEISNTTKEWYLKTRRGKHGGGTWLHPKLAVVFARWLDVRFAIWCDAQIEQILGGMGSVAIEYLPTYHDLHDEAHRLADGSASERFVHMNLNKLINATVGIGAGQRDQLALGQKSLAVVAQMAATNALRASNDHHDGYQNAKQALSSLQSALSWQPRMITNKDEAA
jgi:hypothetical protein